jgi:hypothetical protein
MLAAADIHAIHRSPQKALYCIRLISSVQLRFDINQVATLPAVR